MIDPQRTREVFFEYTLGFLERKKINSFDPEKPMGNYALTMLNEVILGYFVNLKEEVECYLPTVHEWLDFAIERKDPFGDHRRLRHRCLPHWGGISGGQGRRHLRGRRRHGLLG